MNEPCNAKFDLYEDLLDHISSNVCYRSQKNTETFYGTARRKFWNRLGTDQASANLVYHMDRDRLIEVHFPISLLPIGYNKESDQDERSMGRAQKPDRTHEVWDADVKV